MQFLDKNYVQYSDNDTLMRAHPKWKINPDYLMSQDNISDIHEISDMAHPNFAIFFLNWLKKSIDEKKEIQQDYED
jgi:hypothetical protein